MAPFPFVICFYLNFTLTLYGGVKGGTACWRWCGGGGNGLLPLVQWKGGWLAGVGAMEGGERPPAVGAVDGERPPAASAVEEGNGLLPLV